MGCDIHIVAQRRNNDGKWVECEGQFSEGTAPFNWRWYGMFAFLAGVRNYSRITPIAEPRGLPTDFDKLEFEEGGNGFRWIGDHSFSWLTTEELAAVDYEKKIEDRRATRQLANGVFSGSETAEPGHGQIMTLRDFLGSGFFRDLERMKDLGVERIVFGFDN